MNKKAFISISIILITILVIGVFFITKKTSPTNMEEDVHEDRGGEIPQKEIVKKDDNVAIPENTQEKQKNTEILYNPDGSIDTSNWQTYRNEEYGFEVRYPERWVVDNFVTACVGLSNCAIDCEKTPDKCNVRGVSFHGKSNNAILTVSITFVENGSYEYKLTNGIDKKNSEWLTGMFSGCHMTAMKHLNNVRFLFGSFEDVSLADEKKAIQLQNLCENNLLNPFFDEIVESFIVIE